MSGGGAGRPDVILVLAALGAVYVMGWMRLRRRGPALARLGRLALYGGGLAALGLALLSPLGSAASRLFLAHMVQHELLLMVAPVLLLLADPFPAVVWGLPAGARRAVGRALAAGGRARRGLVALTSMPAAWVLSTAALWLWHLPAVYARAVGDGVLHDLEHVVFFASGLLFWWPVVRPAPRVRAAGERVYGILYIVLAHLQNAVLGLGLMLAPVALYPPYAAGGAGMSALDDQAWGGLIMWAGGGAIHMTALLALLARVLGARGGSRRIPLGNLTDLAGPALPSRKTC
jgi:cytochrome c oxidase assembly factor CtaG